MNTDECVLYFGNAQEAFDAARQNPRSVAKRSEDGVGFIVTLKKPPALPGTMVGSKNYTNSQDMLKSFICLGKSVREGGLCIGGKEYSEGVVGPWFRPVGRKQNAISQDSFTFNVGDIVTCSVDSHTPVPPQSENYRLSTAASWAFVGKFPLQNISGLLDSPQTLWENGFDCSTKNGVNDRIPESIACTQKNSLYFICITNASIVKKDESFEDIQRIKLRLTFQYNGSDYCLRITDPNFEKLYWNKLEVGESKVIEKCYITVSLALPYNGHCYKVIAGYVPA